MNASALRPRTVTELIDAAFQLLRRYYAHLVSIAAVFLMPVLILQALGIGGVQVGQPPSVASGVLWLPAFLLTILATAGVVVGVSDSYVRGRIEIRHALERVRQRVWPILLAAFGLLAVVGVLIGAIGFAFFIGAGTTAALAVGGLPVTGLLMLALFVGSTLLGLATYARIFAVPMIVVLEDVSVPAAFARSLALTRGSVWRIIGVFLLVFVLVVAIAALVFAVTMGLLVRGSGRTGLVSVVGTVINMFAYPVVTVFATLLYYDLRIRRDGYDLEMMSRELQAPVLEGGTGTGHR